MDEEKQSKQGKGLALVATFLVAFAKKIVEKVLSIAWENIGKWVKNTLNNLIHKMQDKIVYGFKLLAQKTKDLCCQIIKSFSKKGNDWYETKITRTAKVENVPDEILDELNETEQDFTPVLENVLM